MNGLGDMAGKANSTVRKQGTAVSGSRFSFANDRGEAIFEAKVEPRRRLGWPRLVLALLMLGVFSLVGVFGARLAPQTHRYEARILAIIPEAEGEASPVMSDVLGYARGKFNSRETHEAVLKDIGTDPLSALTIEQEGSAPVVSISADMEDGAFAEMAVNYFANQLTKPEVRDPGLVDAHHALQDTFDKAKAELAAYQAGPANAQSELEQGAITPQEQAAALANLKQAAELARERAADAEKLTIQAVLAGTVPEDIATERLKSFVEQYAQANAEFEALSGKLGPKHPQFLATQTSVNAIRQRIGLEIGRIVKGARAELQHAAAAELAAEKQVATQDAQRQENQGELARLQGAVHAAQANLVDFDQSAPPLPPARFRLISPATSVESGLTDSMFYVLGGIGAGLLAAIIALVMPLSRSAPVYHQVLPFEPASPVEKTPRRVNKPGILEQLDMLEASWPETGRGQKIPVAVNDEAAQPIEPDVRELALRLAALRRRAEKAAQAGSQQAMESALSDMRRLRRKVGILAAARENRSK